MEFENRCRDDRKCDCSIEQEFDFVLLAPEKKETVQGNLEFLQKEFSRLFDVTSKDSCWRVTKANETRRLCTTYPKILVSPKDVSDEALIKDATFRKRGRFPTPVWHCKRTGASLIRGSQPDTFSGFYYGGDCLQTDEKNLQLMFGASSKPPLIIDCRPQANALANLFNHGGTETLMYKFEVVFANVPNVQGVASGLKMMVQQNSCQMWNHNMDSIVQAAVLAAKKIAEGRSVFVHCSDGWDRTSQVISLAELLLDPFYRTLQGFYTLIEKEWVNFGHMFSLRTDNGKLESPSVEWSPIFAQWLNIVWWFTRKNLEAFEFDERILEKLLSNTYNPRLYFGTDVPNLWHGTNAPNSLDAFRNARYRADCELDWDVKQIDQLWDSLYFKLARPTTERKIRKRVAMRRSLSDGNFSELFSRFVQDTANLYLQEEKPSSSVIPSAYAVLVTFSIQGEKAGDREFWKRMAEEGRDRFTTHEGVLHNTVEVTNGKRGLRLQLYTVFRTRKDAENAADLEKKFVQEYGLHNDLVLETTQIVCV